MTIFLRLLTNPDKAEALQASCAAVRSDVDDPRVFHVTPESFQGLPGSPFAYWVSDDVRAAFQTFPALHQPGQREVCSTNPLNADFRFVRLWWEVPSVGCDPVWTPWAKGGAFSKFYCDIHTCIHWSQRRETYFGFIGTTNRPLERPASAQHFFRAGLTWSRRSQRGLSLRAMPQGCIFADKGPAAFVARDDAEALSALLALVNSHAFGLLVSLQMAFGSYEVGVIQKTPIPDLTPDHQTTLADLFRRAWSLKQTLDMVEETSHAFLLPAQLRARLGDYDPPAIERELQDIQAEIDEIAFDLYGFTEADRTVAGGFSAAATAPSSEDAPADEAVPVEADDDAESEDREDDSVAPAAETDSLLSWAVGVAFGRFDLGLATGARAAEQEPEPFDPLPAKSPGMLPDGASPFHSHAGILVDDPGHPQDLALLVEQVLAKVDAPMEDTRRWLQRDFFPFHLQRYSKSRRKAPIYWPLATPSASYTLWIYYPTLTKETLFTAVNDFLEPKLRDLREDAARLAARSERPRDVERRLEAMRALEDELGDLREAILRIARASYDPHQDDGVQITAAPLCELFQNRAWAKVLKETWGKLQKGDHDWSRLAMAYWPDRVREKCKRDKSLAIAHDLVELYVEPPTLESDSRRKKASA